MIYAGTSGSDSARWTWTVTDGSGTTTTHVPVCYDRHRTFLESLRGTNRDRRVETVRCLDCGHRERRVWKELPKAPRPDRVIPLPRAA